MDDMQREPRVAQQSPPAATDDAPGTTAALGRTRMLANPRRVRRA